jgi:ATP-dependent DNA ligase
MSPAATFKGLTDEMLRWQTARFQELEVRRDRWTVYVRPEQVAEIAFDYGAGQPGLPGRSDAALSRESSATASTSARRRRTQSKRCGLSVFRRRRRGGWRR